MEPRHDLAASQPTLLTIGHSNRTLDELLTILAYHKVTQLLDVRSHPQSRRYPSFNRNTLSLALEEERIAYAWLGKELGGMRRPHGDSRHTALTSSNFQGYADHMEGQLFQKGINTLSGLCKKQRVAIMCAERVPNQCHRNLIADYLTIHGWNVIHLLDKHTTEAHDLNPLARVENGTLIYDKLNQHQLDLKL